MIALVAVAHGIFCFMPVFPISILSKNFPPASPAVELYYEAEVEAAALRKEQAADEAASMKAAAARDAAEQFAERKARRKAMAGKSTEMANFLQRQSLADRLDARTRQVGLRKRA